MVEKSDLLDADTKGMLAKIAITNVERVLGTPEAREALGADIRGGQLVPLRSEPELLGRLALFVGQVARREVKVTNLDSKQQRVDYARGLAKLPLPVAPQPTAKPPALSEAGKRPSPRIARPDRTVLIPRTLKLSISPQRINRIFHELQALKIEKFVNSSAVLLRVLIELSVHEYAVANKIAILKTPKQKSGRPPSRPKEFTLREKIKAVVEVLEKSGADKAKLKGVKVLANSKDQLLSVDSLNAMVHNQHYNPTASDLKATWDTLQPFMQILWPI